jgi:hypothetical protein
MDVTFQLSTLNKLLHAQHPGRWGAEGCSLFKSAARLFASAAFDGWTKPHARQINQNKNSHNLVYSSPSTIATKPDFIFIYFSPLEPASPDWDAKNKEQVCSGVDLMAYTNPVIML